MVMAVVEIVVSMVSVGEFGLWFDDVGIILKAFGGQVNVEALVVQVQ